MKSQRVHTIEEKKIYAFLWHFRALVITQLRLRLFVLGYNYLVKIKVAMKAIGKFVFFFNDSMFPVSLIFFYVTELH